MRISNVCYPSTAEANTLCGSCRNLTCAIGQSLDEILVREEPMNQLRVSSLEGCLFCRLLKDLFSPTEYDFFVTIMYWYRLLVAYDYPGLLLIVEVKSPSMEHNGIDSDFSNSKKELRLYPEWHANYLMGNLEYATSRMHATKDPSLNSNMGRPAINQIKAWLETCRRNHPECRKVNFPWNLGPGICLRFIFVGGGQDDDVNVARLVEKDNDALLKDFKYLTLSHRWTDYDAKKKLTIRNYDSYKDKIPFDTMPQTFQDARVIARQLAIPYIWIDSLCIIQKSGDDESETGDWEIQSSLMDRVYSNAELNLAAVEAPARAPGLHVSRDPSIVTPCVLEVMMPSPSKQLYFCFPRGDFARNVDHSDLYARGWTFQERLLSKRNVHFSDQLYWECQSSYASELCPRRPPKELELEFHDNFVQNAKEKLSHIAADDLMSLHVLWSSFVRVYSDTDLSVSSDRLVAIRGLANQFVRTYGLRDSDYLAGLWRPFLAEELIWGRQPDSYHDKGPKQPDLAPSWSWASVRGKNRFLNITRPTVTLSLESPNSRVKEDPSNSLSNDYFIHLLGTRVKEDAAGRVPYGLGTLILKGKVSALSTSNIYPPLSRTASTQCAESEINIDMELDEPCEPRLCNAVILPVLRPHIAGKMLGLVLEPIKELPESVRYRRLGIFKCQPDIIPEFFGLGIETIQTPISPKTPELPDVIEII